MANGALGLGGGFRSETVLWRRIITGSGVGLFLVIAALIGRSFLFWEPLTGYGSAESSVEDGVQREIHLYTLEYIRH